MEKSRQTRHRSTVLTVSSPFLLHAHAEPQALLHHISFLLLRREDVRGTGGAGTGAADQQSEAYHHGSASGADGAGLGRQSSLETDGAQHTTAGPKPPSGGVPRLGRFTR